MNRKALLLVVAAQCVLTLPIAEAADVRASATLDLGGLYGRVDIGGLPPPVLVYPEPVVIQAPPRPLPRQPIYLHVPPGHAKHWSRHCAAYRACGQPVYFVQEGWYRQTYLPAGRGPGPRAAPGAGPARYLAPSPPPRAIRPDRDGPARVVDARPGRGGHDRGRDRPDRGHGHGHGHGHGDSGNHGKHGR